MKFCLLRTNTHRNPSIAFTRFCHCITGRISGTAVCTAGNPAPGSLQDVRRPGHVLEAWQLFSERNRIRPVSKDSSLQVHLLGMSENRVQTLGVHDSQVPVYGCCSRVCNPEIHSDENKLSENSRGNCRRRFWRPSSSLPRPNL